MRLYEVASANPADRLVEYIRTNAAQWMQESEKGTYLAYRGLTTRSFPPGNDDLGDSFAEKAFTGIGSKSGRRPLDTSAIRTVAFDAIIKAAGGIATRSNSIFGTGGQASASSYGHLFVLIPLGTYNYTWSPAHRDWTTTFGVDSIMRMVRPEFRDAIKTMGHWDLNKMTHNDARSSSNYKTMIEILSDPASYEPSVVRQKIIADKNTWSRAVEARHEIMIHCDKVLYVEPNYMKGMIRDFL
jgi:hypothetical protein